MDAHQPSIASRNDRTFREKKQQANGERRKQKRERRKEKGKKRDDKKKETKNLLTRYVGLSTSFLYKIRALKIS